MEPEAEIDQVNAPCTPDSQIDQVSASGTPDAQIDQVDAPCTPKQAALKYLQPPAPSDLVDLTDVGDVNATAVAATAFAASGTALGASATTASHKIRTTLLALAREIRQPRQYIGYSAFVLMGLSKKCQPCVWEGSTKVNLLETFAPWATEHCTTVVPVTGIACTLVPSGGGSAECMPISKKYPLSRMGHFVAGTVLPGTAVAETTVGFDGFYASLGVATIATVCDGDCGLDVMSLMLGEQRTLDGRTDVRIDISDYLFDRVGEPWMQDLMAALQEVDQADITASRSESTKPLAAPSAPAPSCEEPAHDSADLKDVAAPTEETFIAMRWACQLQSESAVLNLIRSLPKEIVAEQVHRYNTGAQTAVAANATAIVKIALGPNSRNNVKMMVAKRFHVYCKSKCIKPLDRLPYGCVKAFIAQHVIWQNRGAPLRTDTVTKWYRAWHRSPSNVVATETAQPFKLRSEQCMLKSRALVKSCQRLRDHGAGTKYKAPLVRQALYEWWSGIRYAIDWDQLIADRRSRGKKHLARFPRSVLRLKVYQFLEDLAYACLLNGTRVQTLKPDSWWFRRWEASYGLSMRKANRKYQVPRRVLKERLEIFWVVLFRLRLFIFLEFGYDPRILNFDQSPFHHNETGSQDKPALGVQGSIVPIVEGNSDCKSRWTANLFTDSQFAAVADSQGNIPKPGAETMFKAQSDAVVNARLQAYLRDKGFPSWFTVTVGPKGSYREHDVISFLKKHLEPWSDGRDWRILLGDDYSAHKSESVWALCWQRGYIFLAHGGGATPVAQTCDTDLNEHVRREYGEKECRLLLSKMRSGAVVPKLSHEECMSLMYDVLSNDELHKGAAAGYKKVGQSIALDGSEDVLICREAGVFWREKRQITMKTCGRR